jgi:hypothetical protein
VEETRDSRSIGAYETLLGALGLALRHLPALALLVLPLTLATSVMFALGAPTLMTPGMPPPGQTLEVPPHEWLAVAGTFLFIFSVGSWAIAALYRSVEAARVEGRAPGFAAAYGDAVERVPALIGTQFLYGCAIAVGLVLCILPGFWVIVLLTPAVPRAATRGEGPLAAIATAGALVRHRWWRVAGYIAAQLVVIYAIFLPFITLSLMLPHGEPWARALYAAGNALTSTLVTVIQACTYTALNDRLEQLGPVVS